MSQKSDVYQYLRAYGPITPLKAQSEFGVFRLASVIHRLRNAGHRIDTKIRRTFSGKPFAEYSLR